MFICAGAFNGLEKIIQRRLGTRAIGFQVDAGSTKTGAGYEIFGQVQPEDLIKYGLIPEFIGRLPVFCVLEDLTEEDLIRALSEPKNALVRQYEYLLRMEGIYLRFTAAGQRLNAFWGKQRHFFF